MEKREFIEMMGEKVKKVNNTNLKNCVIISMACNETGYGRSDLMMRNNAPFGIKATKSWKGGCYSAKTKEYYSSVPTTITDTFRAYNSIEDAVSDYIKLMKSARYKNTLELNNWQEQIKNIIDSGYATDPNYVKNIEMIVVENDLTRFDKDEITLTPTENSRFKVDKVYKLKYNIKVRESFGINSRWLLRKELTENGRAHALPITYAVLKAGTKVTCKAIHKIGDEEWILIPSGWIAGYYNNDYFIEE